MANVVPELVKVGIQNESSWTASPTTSDMLLIPVEPPDIKEEIEHIVDESPRGVLGRDFEAYAGMRKVTGSLKGNFYGSSDASETSVASPMGHLLKAFFGGSDSVVIETSWYRHEFYDVSSTLPGMAVAVNDSLNATASTPCYAGVLIPKLTIRFNSSEGLLTWEAELLGIRQTFKDAASVTIGADKTGTSTLGWHSSVYAAANTGGVTPHTSNPGLWGSTGILLSGEITLEKEIELKVGSAGLNYPNIQAHRPVRATMTAIVELNTDYTAYKKYSNDTTADFSDNLDTWTFRFCNKSAVYTNTTYANLDLATGQSCFDIQLHRVSYGEAPLVIDRSAVSNTMEFHGRALYSKNVGVAGSPAWYGLAPIAAAVEPGAKVAQVRLVNERTTDY